MDNDIALEYRDAPLGDRRRSIRMEDICVHLARDPSLSFPEAMGTAARLEALYRFVNNDAISASAVLAPHRSQTLQRCAAHATILMLHDTTSLHFSSEREGLGRLHSAAKTGFYFHASLAITPEREVLGIVRSETWARTAAPRPKKLGKRVNSKAIRLDPNRESLRWARGALACTELLPKESVVHIMDREGDNFDVFAQLQEANQRFVIRSTHDRKLSGEPLKLRAVMAREPCSIVRSAAVSIRKKSKFTDKHKIHPIRKAGTVQLGISARTVELLRPDTHEPESQKNVTVNIVVVKEQGTPIGEKPIEWNLITSEPIDTVAELESIVDAYRARWVVEEFFKALKTGCRIEKRQLESFAALDVALAMFIPIAVRLLTLRNAARIAPEMPCVALSERQLNILAAITKMPVSDVPTNQEGYLALAALGGHLKRNGDPGWIILGRAYEKLLVLEEGWVAAEISQKK
jgi:hypothetical protein